MSERQRSVGETTSLLFRAFWATSPSSPAGHMQEPSRAPRIPSVMPPSWHLQALQSFPLWLYAAVAHTVTPQNSPDCEPQRARWQDGPQKYLRVLLSEAGLFTSMASSQGISEQRRLRQQLPDHIIQPPLRVRGRTRYAAVRLQPFLG